MNGQALYVEIDTFAAEWLRALIMLDHIAPGDVYCGSLEDLTPEFCSRYTQVHLCAGIGVWSYALRQAGWPDDRPVWTASFPCQPFSAAGQGAGFADERHLWPSGFWLIDQCRPVVLLGEQVASKPGLDWFDLVSSDLEGAGYAVGAHDLCAAGVGAPHIRQRLYFVAHADGWDTGAEREQRSGQHGQQSEDTGAGSRDMALAEGEQQHRARDAGRGRGELADSRDVVDAPSEQAGLSRRTRLTGGSGVEGLDDDASPRQHGQRVGGQARAPRVEARLHEPERRGSPGFWDDVDWIPCRDGKWRPVEPSTFPLAHGAPARVGRLRGYGNAIVSPVAEAFIREVIQCL